MKDTSVSVGMVDLSHEYPYPVLNSITDLGDSIAVAYDGYLAVTGTTEGDEAKLWFYDGQNWTDRTPEGLAFSAAGILAAAVALALWYRKRIFLNIES